MNEEALRGFRHWDLFGGVYAPPPAGTWKLRSNQESTDSLSCFVNIFLFFGSCDQQKSLLVQTGDTVPSFCTHLLGTQKKQMFDVW